MLTTPGIDFSDSIIGLTLETVVGAVSKKSVFFTISGTKHFARLGAQAGVDNDRDGRGIGVIDLDNDGRLDLLQTNANQSPILYHNASQNVGNWIELKLIGPSRTVMGLVRGQVQAGG